MKLVQSVVFLAAALAVAACSASDTAGLPDCYSDSDCDVGQQCKDGSCESLGCGSDKDCRGGMTCEGTNCVAVVNCAADADCNGWRCFSGACVECLADGDCGGDLICIASTCRAGCEQDGDCNSPAPVCDKLTGVCVECTDDNDCATGETCQSGSCIEEFVCKSNTDCQAPNALCDTGSGACVECLSDNDCDLEEECLSGTCVVAGCASDIDCPVETPACDMQSNPPICVRCTMNEYCANDEDGRLICDLERQICVQCLADNDCVNSGGQVSHCLAGEGICVECTRNADCPDSSSCNPETHFCREGYQPCAECDDNITCPPGTKCVEFSGSGGNKGDSGCLRDCVGEDDCTKGFFCDFVIGRMGSCRPAYDKDNGTCQAIRDSLVKTCHDDSSCGVPDLEDGVCVSFQEYSRCSIDCQTTEDCPFSWQCYLQPVDPSAGRVCGPPL